MFVFSQQAGRHFWAEDMIRDRVLKKSFAISLFLHLAILIPWPGLHFLKKKLSSTPESVPILVLYTISSQEKEVRIEGKAESRKPVRTEVAPRPQELSVELKDKKEEQKPASRKEVEDFPIQEGPQPEYAQAEMIDQDKVVDLSREVKSEILPSSILNYYQAIREEIRKKAYYYKPKFKGRGSVRVLFSVSSDGILQSLAIDNVNSSQLDVLREAALKSIRYASPFPPFPPELKSDFITFSIAIEFHLAGY